MKRYALLPTIFLVLGALAFQADWPSVDCKINGLTEARVGQLIVFEAEEADAYDWEVIGGGNYLVDEARLVFSAEVPGNYLIICAVTNDGLVKLSVLNLCVKGRTTPIIDIIPEIIDVIPDVPPIVDDIIDIVIDPFDAEVLSWLPANYDKATATRLAYAFNLTAASGAKDVDALLKLATLSNRAALGNNLEEWKPFLEAFSVYCQENLQNASVLEHERLWTRVANLLSK